MTLKQLERLAKNPNYKMSARHIQMLEAYRAEQYRNERKVAPVKSPNVKHSTDVELHSRELPKEKEKNAGESK